MQKAEMEMKCNLAVRHGIKEKIKMMMKRRRRWWRRSDGKYFIRTNPILQLVSSKKLLNEKNYFCSSQSQEQEYNAELRSFCERKCNKKLIEFFSHLLRFFSSSRYMGDNSSILFPLTTIPYVYMHTYSLAF